MAVLIEAYTVLVLREKLERYLPGGDVAFAEAVPNSTGVVDRDLCSASFMVEADATQFIRELVQRCPDASLNALDPVIVSSNNEQPDRPWLAIADWDGSLIAWKHGEDPNPLLAYPGWEPGKQRIQHRNNADLDAMEFLGEENGVQTYRNPETGEKVYVSRPKMETDRKFDEALELLNPFIEIVGRTQPSVSAEEKVATVNQGMQLLREVLDVKPKHWRSWWFLGKAHQTLGENQEAYDALRTAFELEKDDPNVAREFMRECLELGHIDIALQAAEHAATVRPDDDGLVSNLALALLFAEQHKAALKTAKRAYKMKKDPITKNLVGYIKAVMKGSKPQPRTFSDLG